VKDRTYFKASIYFSDPDGLVFELATEGPGSPATREEPGSEEIDPFEEGYEK